MQQEGQSTWVALAAPLAPWLTSLAWVAYVAILISFSRVADWAGWKSDLAPAWVQAYGSIGAIVAGAAAIWWQMKHQNERDGAVRHAEDVRRLQQLWTLVYHSRVDIDKFIEDLGYVEGGGITPDRFIRSGLAPRVESIRRIAVFDIPDADTTIAVQHFIEAWDDFVRGTQFTRDSHNPVPVRKPIRPAANAAQESFRWAERNLRLSLVARGTDIPSTLFSIKVNGVAYPPLDLD